ncbi:MAG: PPC domain-containing DNA-binding protein [Chitinophagaceae bacterium]
MVHKNSLQRSLTEWAVLTVALLTIAGSWSCKNSKAMHSNNIIHAFRLKPGEDLKQSILKYVNDHQMAAGFIVTCVGSLTHYDIRFANQPDGTTGTGHFEIVSLTGVLGIAGSHIHISISDSTGKTIGGHLMDGCKIYTTAEIVIGEDKSKFFRREVDSTFGYKELKVE